MHTGGGKGDCNREGIVYRGQCMSCKNDGKTSVYIGESSRSGYVRGRQHAAAIREPERNKSNAFAKHLREHHDGERDVKFEMDIVGSYKRPIERQLREGVEIARAEVDMLLNSK